MACPDCKSGRIELIKREEKKNGWLEIEHYKCNKCGIEWKWEITKSITKTKEEVVAEKVADEL